MDVPGWSAGPTVIQRIPPYATSLRTSQSSVAQTRRRMLAPDEDRKRRPSAITVSLSHEGGCDGRGIRTGPSSAPTRRRPAPYLRAGLLAPAEHAANLRGAPLPVPLDDSRQSRRCKRSHLIQRTRAREAPWVALPNPDALSSLRNYVRT